MQTSPPHEPGASELPDRKRERFCEELAAGEPLYRAYELAGFKLPKGNAQRMVREPEVAARLGYLGKRIEALNETLIAYRREQHRRALEHLASADRLELFSDGTAKIANGMTKTGKPRFKTVRRLSLKPLEQLTAEQRALIDGIEISEKGAVKVLMPKRLDARAMLAKLDGLDKPEKRELTGKDGAPLMPEFTDEQRAQALAAFFARTAVPV